MKKFLFVCFLLAIVGATFGFWLMYMPNINTQKRVSVKIPTGSKYNDVMQLLQDNKVLKSELSFHLMSLLKKYPDNVKAGYYVFGKSMNNRQIVNMLMGGLQTPVTMVIYNIRTKDEFAGLVGRTLELDSNEILEKLKSPAFCKAMGTDTAKVLARFIVDNYEFYWNTPQKRFFEKLNESYSDFWNAERLSKAEEIHLTADEVVTLASIVEKEVIRDKELTTVAGVYLNRLKIGMPLQADPTLVFALKDFDARRVTSVHKDFDSPYNTYKYAGLPPGPICMPRKKSIDAVLNYEEHKYLYFCANPDMSGFSIFSKTYDEQINVARQYRKKLDAMNIR
jgi:UPF0755 protein